MYVHVGTLNPPQHRHYQKPQFNLCKDCCVSIHYTHLTLVTSIYMLYTLHLHCRYEQPTVEGLKEDNLGNKMLQVHCIHDIVHLQCTCNIIVHIHCTYMYMYSTNVSHLCMNYSTCIFLSVVVLSYMFIFMLMFFCLLVMCHGKYFHVSFTYVTSSPVLLACMYKIS